MSLIETTIDESPNAIELAAPSVPVQVSESLREIAYETITLRRVSSLTGTEFAALEQLAFEYGRAPDSYLAVEKGRMCFLAPDLSAAASVHVTGRYLHVTGGILGPPDAQRRVIDQLRQLAQREGLLINCFSLNEQDRALFEENGWEVSKFGENTSLSLIGHSWGGKRHEWVRRQANYCQRAGLTCREVRQDTMSTNDWQCLWEQLAEIHQADLKHRVYSEDMGMLVGRLEPDNMQRRRLFVAEAASGGQIEAYVIANPMAGGKGWAFENFRRRPASPRGTMPFLMKWTIDQLKAEGVTDVSLCMLPWKGTQTFKGIRTSFLLRWGLMFAYHVWGNLLYGTKGMTRFKTRFRPELTNCYVAVTPRATMLSCINFLDTVGAFSFNSRNLTRHLWRWLTRQKGNESHD